MELTEEGRAQPQPAGQQAEAGLPAAEAADTSEPVVHYAGFSSRLFAWVLDSILQLLVLAPVIWYFLGPEALLDPAYEWNGMNYWLDLATLLVILLFWKFRSATPGKLMMGLKIVDADTLGEVPFRRQVYRLLAYAVSLLPLCLGFVWIAYDKRKQGFHDKLARTLVIVVSDDSGGPESGDA